MFLIIQWNCQGYRSKYEDLKHLLYLKNPAVLLLQETMLGNHDLRPPRGYSIYCDYNNPIPGNGLATLIRNDIPHLRYDVRSNLQVTAFRVGLNRQYTLCNIYIPPNFTLTLDTITSVMDQLPHPIMICGDFNCRHHLWDSLCTRPDARALKIERALLSTRLTLLNNGNPTHFHIQTGSSSAIDLTMSSADASPNFLWTVMEDLHGSDHYPICIVETASEPYTPDQIHGTQS